MKISTRGRYALRVIIDLAERQQSGYVPLSVISAEQGISQKYMESIMTLLSKNGIVEAIHGKGGGYKLNRSPEKYSVGEILRLTEGSITPVNCVSCNGSPCGNSQSCRTRPMWEKLDSIISGYLDSVTVASLMENNK